MKILKTMENRIQINGEWYIKEDTINTKENSFDSLSSDELSFTSKITYETSDYLFEFTILDYKYEYCMPSMYIENKLSKQIEVWDSEEFLTDLIKDNVSPDNLSTITIVDAYGLHIIKEILKFAEEKQYI